MQEKFKIKDLNKDTQRRAGIYLSYLTSIIPILIEINDNTIGGTKARISVKQCGSAINETYPPIPAWEH